MNKTIFILILILVNCQYDLQDYGVIIDNIHKARFYWGTYKPNLYFAMKNRLETSDNFGIMWYGADKDHYLKQGDITNRLRHNCRMEDGLTYKWEKHNGLDYGNQVINDKPNNLKLETTFIKHKYEKIDEQQWSVLLNGTSIEGVSNISMILYVNMENYALTDKAYLILEDNSIKAYEKEKEKFSIDISIKEGKILNRSYQNYRKIYNETWRVKRFVSDDLVNSEKISNYTDYIKFDTKNLKQPNIIAIQFTFQTPFLISLQYKSYGLKEITYEDILLQIEKKNLEFDEKFNKVFKLKDDKLPLDAENMGKEAISNILGGIGYFYGAIKINLEDKKEGSYHKGFRYAVEPKGLFTATPSRSFFARGFLWDEGFHNILISKWDVDISLDILDSWLSTMSATGWIAREQIRGAEAESQVPEKFIVQDKLMANPPTLIFPIESIMNYYKYNAESNDKRIKLKHNFLKKCFDKLGSWFEWFEIYQKDSWHGRTSSHNLASGLDDYPRGMTTNIYERHLDLHIWILELTRRMRDLSEIFDYELVTHFDKRIKKGISELKTKFFDKDNNIYSDYLGPQFKLTYSKKFNKKVPPYTWRGDNKCGSEAPNPLGEPSVCNPYSDAPCCSEFGWCGNSVNHCSCPKCNKAKKLEEFIEKENIFNPHLGYVNLYPIAFGLVDKEDIGFRNILNLLADDNELYSDYGIRSLSKSDILYHTGEDYWRGNIWINLNYLVLKGLYKFYKADEQAYSIYKKLRNNIIRTVYKNWKNTGLFYEQYSDITGEGQRVRPFNGWTSLILEIMTENYNS